MPLSSGAVASYLEDSSGYHGEAEEVFLPSNTSELRELICRATREQIPLTVAGAGTGLTGARVPHGGWIVSLERFKKLEIEHGRARCGAGVLLRDLHEAGARSKQFFGPNPTEDSACIGGIINTNAGGARSFHYGAVRRHVLSLEVTFMNGETERFERGGKVDFPFRSVRNSATTKNAAGYPLRPGLEWVELLSGSEGTLGVVTEAELELLPEPPAVLSGVIFFSSEEDAFSAVDAWRSLPELRLLEFMDENALKLLRPLYSEIPTRARAALLIEQNLRSEEDEEVDSWLERLGQQAAFEEDSWFGFRAADRERFREFRHVLPVMVTDTVRRRGYSKFSTDFAVPISRNRDLHHFYKQCCEELLPGQYTIFGHVGDANNHVNLLPATGDQAKQGERMMHRFAEYVVSLNGTVAAEHGIGKSKTDLFKLMYAPDEIEAMKDVKRRLDPQWLLGRGTIFPV